MRKKFLKAISLVAASAMVVGMTADVRVSANPAGDSTDALTTEETSAEPVEDVTEEATSEDNTEVTTEEETEVTTEATEETTEVVTEEDTEVTTEEEQSTTSIESVLYEAKDSRAVGELIGEHKDDIDSYAEGKSSKYSLKRLMLFTSDKLKESYNATDIIHIGDYEEYVLQFETEEDTEAAYNSLLAKYGKDSVFIDQVLDADSLFGDQTYAASVEVKFTNAYSLNDTVLNQNGVSYSSYTPISWGVKDMGMDVLKSDFNNHNFTNSVKVAVVDTGLDDSHYIFNGRVDVDHSYNFADGSWNYTDENGHGTHVAGTICDATPSNVYILACRAFDSDGYATDTSLAAAMQYAVSQKADVINCSFGKESADAESFTYLNTAINAAYKQNTIICVASGNSTIDVRYAYPANNGKVITVASIDEYHNTSYFSNYGKSVNFSAPGENIRAAFLNGREESLNGTSMATPHISAACAYIKMVNKNGNLGYVYNTLKSYAKDLGPKGWDEDYGYGYVDLTNYFYDTFTYTKLKNITQTSKGIYTYWYPVDGATAYTVYRKVDNGSWKTFKTVRANATSFCDTTASTKHVYSYTVRAHVNGKQGTYNKTGLSIKRIGQPTTKTYNWSNGISVEWGKVAGVTDYKIYRKAGSETSWKLVGSVKSTSSRFVDTDVKEGSSYRYLVKAMSGSYSSGCENNKTSVIYRLGYRYAGSFKNSMRGLLSIKWARTAACDGYQVMYADNKNFTGAYTTTLKGNTNGGLDISVGQGKTWYAKVRCYKKVNGVTYYSAWGNVVSCYAAK